jgi:hypothetical protein
MVPLQANHRDGMKQLEQHVFPTKKAFAEENYLKVVD